MPPVRRIPLIAGLTAFILLVSGGLTWAHWTASVSGTGALTTQSATVAHSNFSAMTATYLPSSLSRTAPFTVTNTGQIAGTATITISTPGTLAAQLPIRVWQVTASNPCTDGTATPTSAASGTWASPPALTPTLNAGASITYCVRTTIPDWKPLAASSGTRSATPAINVTLNASGWIASSPSASHTQTTAGMYPLANGFFNASLSPWHTVQSPANASICMDASGSGSSNGTLVISWSCHDNSNQRWQFLPVSGTDQNLVTIRPRHAPNTRLTYNSSNAAILSATTGSIEQQWYVQRVNSTTYQLVSAANGRCLALRGNQDGAAMPTVPCNSSQAQLRFQHEPLAMSQYSEAILGILFPTYYVQFNFSSAMTSQGVTLQRWTGTAWQQIGTASAGATSVRTERVDIPTGNSTYRIVYTGNTHDVVYGGIQLTRNGDIITAPGGIG